MDNYKDAVKTTETKGIDDSPRIQITGTSPLLTPKEIDIVDGKDKEARVEEKESENQKTLSSSATCSNLNDSNPFLTYAKY